MDKRARRAFEDEHKGPSKFAGKRAEHRTQEELRWRVPHGLQWVEKHEDHRDAVWATTYRRYALTSISIIQQLAQSWMAPTIGPENISNVDRHTEVMSRSSSSEQSRGWVQRYGTAHKLRVLQDHKISC